MIVLGWKPTVAAIDPVHVLPVWVSILRITTEPEGDDGGPTTIW